MIREYKNPAYQETAFNCPHCNVLAKMDWYNLSAWSGSVISRATYRDIENKDACECTNCYEYSLWELKTYGDAYEHIMIYPSIKHGEPAHIEMPEDVKLDYEEARLIFGHSPRGAAALLRLTLQKLMVYLGEDGSHIHSNIKNLIAKNTMSDIILKALDATRIIGNESVHPGRMLESDREIVSQHLFKFINLVIEKGIAEPKLVEEMYSKTPETKREL